MKHSSWIALENEHNVATEGYHDGKIRIFLSLCLVDGYNNPEGLQSRR